MATFFGVWLILSVLALGFNYALHFNNPHDDEP